MSIFNSLLKTSSKYNSDSFQLSDENNPYNIEKVIPTGCYMLNAMLSDGNINKGFLGGSRIMLSGESASYKSYLALKLGQAFLQQDKNATLIIFESEKAQLIRMANDLNFPLDRVIINPISTVRELKSLTLKLLNDIKEHNINNEKEANVMFILDSLGMLSEDFEIDAAEAGTDKADVGRRAKSITSYFRTISLKLGLLNIPYVIVNHVYDSFSMYTPKTVAGGSGAKYAVDISLMLSKSKDKDGTSQKGNNIKLKVHKHRFLREDRDITLNVSFDEGLNKYSGLVDFAAQLNILKKEGHSYAFPDGTKVKMKLVKKSPEKYIDDKLLDTIGKKIKEYFSFGKD